MGYVEVGLPGAIISLQTTKRFPFQPTADLKNSFAKKHSLEFPEGKRLLSCPLEKVSTQTAEPKNRFDFASIPDVIQPIWLQGRGARPEEQAAGGRALVLFLFPAVSGLC